MITIYTKW